MEKQRMSVLFYGAGTIGSTYAARLQDAGHNVSILARGKRLSDIREHGIVLRNELTGEQTTTRVNVVEEFLPEDAYDLAVVAMRKNQVAQVLPILAANERTPNIMFMVSNPSGFDEWIEAVGSERLLLGFPGAGGTVKGHVVHCVVLKKYQQATTLAELDGRATPRLSQMIRCFESAGFPVETTDNMDAWLKTHAAWIAPLSGAVHMAQNNGQHPSKMPKAIHLMIQAVREGFQVLDALDISVTPDHLNYWRRTPKFVLGLIYRSLFKTKVFEISLIGHTNVAPDESWHLAQEFKALALRTSVPTPALDRLIAQINYDPV